MGFLDQKAYFVDVVDCFSPKLFIYAPPAVNDTTYFIVSLQHWMIPVFTFLKSKDEKFYFIIICLSQTVNVELSLLLGFDPMRLLYVNQIPSHWTTLPTHGWTFLQCVESDYLLNYYISFYCLITFSWFISALYRLCTKYIPLFFTFCMIYCLCKNQKTLILLILFLT